MDKRFLYLVLIIVIILVVILAWQDSQKQSTSIMDKLNATPTPAIGVSPVVSPQVQQSQNPSTPLVNQNSPAQNSSPSAIVELEGGVKIQELTVGTGTEVKSGDTIAVNYIGYLENGQKFDSSYDRNKPFIVQIGAGQVIKGWDIGIIGMKEGGKRRIYIPSALAYGDQGAGNGLIPPNANLIFDVELLSVK